MLVVRLLRTLTFIVPALWFTMPIGAAYAAPPDEAAAADELLVGLRAGVTDDDADTLYAPLGAARLERLGPLPIHLIRVAPAAIDATADALARRPEIRFVERNRRHGPTAVPNDPSYPDQWHHPKISSPGAWDIGTGAGVTIAILDSGVDGTHPDLAPKMVAGYNFVDKNTNTADVYGHGTRVAGTAAATGNNGIGVAGVSWASRIMPIRVSDSTGYATSFAIASGLTWAVDHGARVMNISIGGIASSFSITTAAQYVVSKGGVVVVAAGNCGCLDLTPDNAYMVSVSATDSGDSLANFSSYGPYVDVSAPGVNILTTNWGGGYKSMGGTSHATPIVSGVIALMMSANPSLSPASLETLLQANADDKGLAGWDQKFGWGRVNAYRAVAAAAGSLPKDTTPPTASITAPSAGAVVSGGIAVNVSALDGAGVVRVDLSVDGVLLASDTTSPYTFFWDTTKVVNGLHTLTAKAVDAAGNVGTSLAVVVDVENVGPVAEIIIDNAPVGFQDLQSGGRSFIGTWCKSGVVGYYGADALYGCGSGSDTYRWTPIIPVTRSYDVYVRWTAYSTRSTTVPYTVQHAAGQTTKTFNQQTSGGVWVLHGRYTLNAGAGGYVQVSDVNGQAIADAVRFVPVP